MGQNEVIHEGVFNMRTEKVTDKITLYNCDCMEFMKDIPDNYFELAIVILKCLHVFVLN